MCSAGWKPWIAAHLRERLPYRIVQSHVNDIIATASAARYCKAVMVIDNIAGNPVGMIVGRTLLLEIKADTKKTQ